MIILLGLILAFQDPQIKPQLIWEQIAGMEGAIHESVKASESGFTTSNNDPVHGYYIQHIGVVMLIPVRYSPKASPRKREEGPMATLGAPSKRLDRSRIQKRVQAWTDEVNRSAMLKDTNFEKVVSNLRDKIPSIIATLSDLPGDESLVLVIEERAPAWFYAGFDLRKDATRKVVTLTVDKDLMSTIHANKTVMEKDWLRRVKRTTTNRKIISGLLSGTSLAE